LQRGICFANYTPRCKALRRQAGSALPVNLALGIIMKRIVIYTSLLLAGCNPTNVQPKVSLDTVVSGRHVQDVSRDVQQWHDMQYPKCAYEKVLGTKIVKSESNSSTEHWTIGACEGKSFTYKVLIMQFSNGGIGDSVFNVDDSPMKTNNP